MNNSFKDEHVDILISTLKSLFDNSDEYVRINREGYLESNVMIINPEVDITGADYDDNLNEQLVEKMDGELIIRGTSNYVGIFELKNKAKIVMCQYPNESGDEIYFTFQIQK